jgi:hypothetical protein
MQNKKELEKRKDFCCLYVLVRFSPTIVEFRTKNLKKYFYNSRRMNPLNYLRSSLEPYDLQISHHYGAHPRVNIGLFFVRPSNLSISFFSHIAEFWVRYGKGGYLSDQRVLDALLNNYDRLDKTYLRAMKPSSSKFNWTTHDFGNHFSHLMTDGSAFILFNQAAKLGIRSKKFHGDPTKKYFTVHVTDV